MVNSPVTAAKAPKRVDENHSILLKAGSYVYLPQDGCILDDDIVGMMYFTPETNWFVVKAAKSLDRFSLPIATASEEGKCLAVFSVVKGSYRKKLRQNQGSLPPPSVYPNFLHQAPLLAFQ
jgi:hypothetical protein